MPTVNVFKLARNADYNLKQVSSENGRTSSNGRRTRLPSTRKPNIKSPEIHPSYHPAYKRVSSDFVMADENPGVASATASVLTLSGPSASENGDSSSENQQNVTSRDLEIPSKSQPALEDTLDSCVTASKMDSNAAGVHLEAKLLSGESPEGSKNRPVDLVINLNDEEADSGGSRNQAEASKHHFEAPSSTQSNNGTPSSANFTPISSSTTPVSCNSTPVSSNNAYPLLENPARGPTNGHVNGLNCNQPEPFKRLINEAPFLTTAHEPPQDLENAEVSTISTTVSRTASTRSKAESQVSISTFNLELEWMDTNLIKEGRAFVRRNFLSIMFAHFVGLAFLLTIRPVAAILLRNGKFHRPAKRHNWHTYLVLFRKLKSWYEKGDFADPDDPSTVQLLKLRRSMCSAGKNFRKFLPPPAQELTLTEDESACLAAMKSDLEDLKDVSTDGKNLAKIFATVNPDVPWSQYDLAVTQFAFFGLVTLFPKVFGIHNKKGMEGFVHFWAVLGHLLGLENRFNLCKNYDEETNKMIFRDVFLFSFRIMDNGSFRMFQRMCDGARLFTVFMTKVKLVFLFVAKELAYVQSTKNEAIRWYDRIEYCCWMVWRRWIVRIFFMRMLGNLVARVVLSAAFGVMSGQLRWRAWRAKRRKHELGYSNSIHSKA